MGNSREAAQQATPREQLLKELMDSRVPKTEREHAAVREIERLRAALAEDAMQRLADEQQMIGRGTKAWADVPDATAWVEELRGNESVTNCHEKEVDKLPHPLDVPETNFGNMAQAVDSTEADHVHDATKMMASVREDRTVEPVAYIKGYSKGRCIIEAVDPDWLLPVGMALYRSPPTSQESRQVEPVAWRVHPFDYGVGIEGAYAMTMRPDQAEAWKRKGWNIESLYTAPPKRKPLTEQQIMEIEKRVHFHESPDWAVRFARELERAHGIGGDE